MGDGIPYAGTDVSAGKTPERRRGGAVRSGGVRRVGVAERSGLSPIETNGTPAPVPAPDGYYAMRRMRPVQAVGNTSNAGSGNGAENSLSRRRLRQRRRQHRFVQAGSRRVGKYAGASFLVAHVCARIQNETRDGGTLEEERWRYERQR